MNCEDELTNMRNGRFAVAHNLGDYSPLFAAQTRRGAK
jgi:hypothetical protein